MLVYQARSVPTKYNEGKYISFCVANNLQTTLFAVLLAAYFAWTTLWALGYLPALGIVGVVEMLLPGSHMVSVDYR